MGAGDVVMQSRAHALENGWSYVIERNPKGLWRAVVRKHGENGVVAGMSRWYETRDLVVQWALMFEPVGEL